MTTFSARSPSDSGVSGPGAVGIGSFIFIVPVAVAVASEGWLVSFDPGLPSHLVG